MRNSMYTFQTGSCKRVAKHSMLFTLYVTFASTVKAFHVVQQ